ncbi:MAG: hypothetical protein UY23_C0001G0028 [Candidatus Jorgensenbacteria bacterium GW2011_GWA1_48_11]|uniref:DUF192 domain-containing protein n=1 Tax=Candidatus Jorgensenbacteria bacterium GW2011_GWA1_48_11 TaxID=1618660 RepID=A0A0G1UBD1_9BACT|nr:MAG: hypothetical protein UY23_C0001G0028 [Candidatus Jorgensenbacteria bacterium GW2011_GWA1_48_11]KKW11917.1 MAG: hypothetical protein UY51_C0005G0159 [Candidatus Jorgensenbacteria bacterium GW2011_GWB1_49_9]
MSGFFVKLAILFFGMILITSLFITPYLNQVSSVQRKSEVKINNQSVVVEVVSSAKDITRGLGGREGIGVNEGMLFLFDRPGNYSFWMKDMRFPIDIVWIAHGQVVGFEENVDPQIGAKPEDLKVYNPLEPVDRVLELHAGRVGLLKTVVGDYVKVRPLISAKDLFQ